MEYVGKIYGKLYGKYIELEENPAIEIIEGEIAIIKKNISLHIAPHSSAYAKNVLINMLNKIKGL
jgi:hypothetical protein